MKKIQSTGLLRHSNVVEIKDKSKRSTLQIPAISLPKGGGALKGIDEKFEVNPSNGTAIFAIPLPITTGRNDFSPTLSLQYNSGGGNHAFGLGWSVDLMAIQRRTDKQLPRYNRGEEDVFVLAGGEDLVPYLIEDDCCDWQTKKRSHRRSSHTIASYWHYLLGKFNSGFCLEVSGSVNKKRLKNSTCIT